MKKSLCRGLIAFTSLAALASCQDYDGGFSNDLIKKAEYAKQFEKTFGTPDPNQDWSMATLVKANVNLPGLSGTAKMNICTGDPRNAETRLLAQIMLKDGQGSIDFDAIKGVDNVFVTVEQDGQYKVFSQYPLQNGMLNIGEISLSTRAAVPGKYFSATCPTTLNDQVQDFFVISSHIGGIMQTAYYFNENPGWQKHGPYATFNEAFQAWIDHCVANGFGSSETVAGWQSGVKKIDGVWTATGYQEKVFTETAEIGGRDVENHVNLQYLNNVETVAATPWTRGYGYSLYGPKAFFQEQQYYYGKNGKTEDKYNYLYGSTETEKLAMLAQIEEGFKIKTKGGIIDLPFIYGATDIIDQFGYVFYTDDQDPLDQPHYVLMEDGRPDVNVYQNAWGEGKATGFTGTGISTWVEGLKSAIDYKDKPIDCYCSEAGHTGIYGPTGVHESSCKDHFVEYTNAYNEKVYGTTYRMVYFDSEGHATYNIPAGLNVVFFICPVGSAENLTSRTGYNKGDFHYSDPKLNQRINHLYFNTASPSYNNDASPLKQTEKSGAVKACSWFDGTHYYLGFEDGGRDEDLNDIIFWVDGAFETTTTNPDIKVSPIKWHLNYTGSHMTDDTDLFSVESNKKVGDSYTQPSSNPKWEGHTFLGWSEDPRGSVIAGSDEPGFITGTVPDGGKCYYAIWSLPEVPGNYTIKWHKNYSQEHDTSDADLHASENVNSGAKYSKPSTDPTAPAGKVFVGWSTDPNATPSNVISDEELINVTATGNVCYFAIYDEVPTSVPDPEWISWIFACEDLGGSFDYDFNDVVWEVRHDGTSGKVQARLLAAGGTLPFTLRYNGTEICTKASVYGADNVSKVFISRGSDWYDVLTDTNWKISDNSDKFSVVVEVEDEESTYSSIITGPTTGAPNNEEASKNPEVILVPGNWEWPNEGVCIKDAYKDFTNWVFSAGMTGWADSKQSSMVISRQQSEIIQ